MKTSLTILAWASLLATHPVGATEPPGSDAQRTRATSAAVQQAEPAVAAPAMPAKARRAAAKPASPAADGGRKAMDRLELDTSQITGNRELPKVMVVVPWKRSDIGDLAGRPVNSLVDEALQPVDREVFRREIDYYRALAPDHPRSETSVTGAAPVAQPEK